MGSVDIQMYNCKTFCDAINSGEINQQYLLAFMIHVTAFLGELQDRLENQNDNINEWKKDALDKVNFILGVENEEEDGNK